MWSHYSTIVFLRRVGSADATVVISAAGIARTIAFRGNFNKVSPDCGASFINNLGNSVSSGIFSTTRDMFEVEYVADPIVRNKGVHILVFGDGSDCSYSD